MSDIYNQIRELGAYASKSFDKMVEDFNKQINDAYRRGLEDAWKAARKIATWPDRSLINSDTFDLDPGENIFVKYSASEAIEKLKAYEEKQEADSIKVGDEVCLKDEGINGDKGLILRTDNETCTVMWADDGSAGIWPVDEFAKTGRHFDVQSILEAMRI